MSNATYTASTTYQTIFQSGQGQPAVGLINRGTSVLYIDSIPQASSDQGFPLNPGATYQWMEKTALYLIAPALGGVLDVLWDQAVPYFDPVSLASAINLVGVPAIDAPTTILNQTQSVASTVTPVSSIMIDVSRYQSVYGLFSEGGINNIVVTRDYTLTWYSDASGSFALSTETFQCGTYQGSAQWQRPVKGAFLQVTSTSAATVVPSALRWTIVGSLRTIPVRTVLRSGKNNTSGKLVAGNDVNKGLMIFDASVPNTGGDAIIDYPNLVTGPQVLSMRTVDSPTDVLAIDLKLWNGQTYWAGALSSTQNKITESIIIPPNPLLISASNFGGGAYELLCSLIAAPN